MFEATAELDDLYGSDPELVAMFVGNASELLDQIEVDLLELEKVSDEEVDELVNRVFRSAHTIKGESSFVSLDNIGKLAHTVENVLDLIRDHEIDVDRRVVNTLLESFDRLRQLVDDVEASHDVDLSSDLAKLQSILDGSVYVAAAAEDDTLESPAASSSPATGESDPVADSAHEVDGDTASENKTNTDRVRVLIIDDEPMVARLVARQLSKVNIPSEHALDPQESLRMMRRGLHNVVICDLNLPDMSGTELVPMLKAISPMVQIIMLTGDANLVTVMESLEAGAMDFVQKSQNYRDLVEPVQQALDRADRWIPLMRSRR